MLCVVSAFSLFACSNKETPAPTEEKKDFSAYAGIIVRLANGELKEAFSTVLKLK